MFLRTFLVAIAMLQAASANAEPVSWPQELVSDTGFIVTIYQPQVEAFSGNSLEGRAAVAVKKPEDPGMPVFGAIWFTARLDTDRDTRTAIIRDLVVSEVRFADATATQKEDFARFVEQEIGAATLTISVDQLLADLDAGAVSGVDTELQHAPPRILLSTAPALLVSIDGKPTMRAIEGTDYERVLNTPFLIVRDKKDFYLYVGGNAWFAARDVMGPWAHTRRVPENIARLVEPAEEDAENIEKVRIVMATEPTELIVADGEPTWSPVEGMDLLYMDNTDSNVFLELSTQSYYVLLSGRWYRGTGVIGDLDWTHVANDALPSAFGDIPESSVNGAVLSQVAGTRQAREAVLDNSIPQTAAIDRDDKSFTVTYDGDPAFAPIEDIRVEYAQNTAAAVFRYGNLYYACDDGVWYVANSATGPWSVATEIPDAIYRIPASNPHHNVTYVKVYDVTPEVVYVGYTPGYYGSYYYSGSIVYGTGWYYNPWYGPWYYPRYPTWGFHVTYNPWYGWGFGVSWTYGPFRFTYGGHHGWWGVGGYRPYPRPYVGGGYRKTNININIDNSINIGGGRARPETRPNLYNRPENRERMAERPARPTDRRARPAETPQNNVLTDRSGNVYQRRDNGEWQQRDNGQWRQPSNLDRSTRPSQPTMPDRSLPHSQQWQPAVRPQLERDFNARQSGANRSRSFESQRPSRRR